MFAKRATPLSLDERGTHYYDLLIENPNTTKESLERYGTHSPLHLRNMIVTQRLVAFKTKIQKYEFYIPEYQLVNRTKHYTNLSPVEADYFAAKLLGKKPLIRPVDPNNIMSSLICVDETTDSWLSPTLDWGLAKQLKEEFRILVERKDKELYVAHRSIFEIRETSACESVVYAALARDEPYLIHYSDQAFKGFRHDNPIYRRDTTRNAQGARGYTARDTLRYKEHIKVPTKKS